MPTGREGGRLSPPRQPLRAPLRQLVRRPHRWTGNFAVGEAHYLVHRPAVARALHGGRGEPAAGLRIVQREEAHVVRRALGAVVRGAVMHRAALFIELGCLADLNRLEFSYAGDAQQRLPGTEQSVGLGLFEGLEPVHVRRNGAPARAGWSRYARISRSRRFFVLARDEG